MAATKVSSPDHKILFRLMAFEKKNCLDQVVAYQLSQIDSTNLYNISDRSITFLWVQIQSKKHLTESTVFNDLD